MATEPKCCPVDTRWQLLRNILEALNGGSPPSGTERITEEGDTRITEEGDTRIINP